MKSTYDQAIGALARLLSIHKKLKTVRRKLEIQREGIITELEAVHYARADYRVSDNKIVEFVLFQEDDGEYNYHMLFLPAGSKEMYNIDLGKKIFMFHKSFGRNLKRT